MEKAVDLAMTDIFMFVRPQILIADSPSREDVHFYQPLTAHASKQRATLIELPVGGLDKLMWMTRLDIESLKGMSCKSPISAQTNQW